MGSYVFRLGSVSKRRLIQVEIGQKIFSEIFGTGHGREPFTPSRLEGPADHAQEAAC
jgi:hypothetical protein